MPPPSPALVIIPTYNERENIAAAVVDDEHVDVGNRVEHAFNGGGDVLPLVVGRDDHQGR